MYVHTYIYTRTYILVFCVRDAVSEGTGRAIKINFAQY